MLCSVQGDAIADLDRWVTRKKFYAGQFTGDLDKGWGGVQFSDHVIFTLIQWQIYEATC